ncbi:hypothetical protein [Aliivibrio fischeri]|uniref:hypothetical protein n=1 Tax=Aliivibrio fischeri TaxID=668 RepID=UPI00080E9B0B|nr:hypothetical protein [Aliivibrio fischeri]OCH37371.1 hypothetical protein A6E02_18640 [Aliivibrio fischeri]
MKINQKILLSTVLFMSMNSFAAEGQYSLTETAAGNILFENATGQDGNNYNLAINEINGTKRYVFYTNDAGNIIVDPSNPEDGNSILYSLASSSSYNKAVSLCNNLNIDSKTWHLITEDEFKSYENDTKPYQDLFIPSQIAWITTNNPSINSGTVANAAIIDKVTGNKFTYDVFTFEHFNLSTICAAD